MCETYIAWSGVSIKNSNALSHKFSLIYFSMVPHKIMQYFYYVKSMNLIHDNIFVFFSLSHFFSEAISDSARKTYQSLSKQVTRVHFCFLPGARCITWNKFAFFYVNLFEMALIIRKNLFWKSSLNARVMQERFLLNFIYLRISQFKYTKCLTIGVSYVQISKNKSLDVDKICKQWHLTA